MLFRRKLQKNRKRQSAWLYSVVFNGHISAFGILLLFASFLVQPFHQAMAAEPLPEEPAVEAIVAADVREQPAVEESPPANESPPAEDSPPVEESVIEAPPEPVSDTGDLSLSPDPIPEDNSTPPNTSNASSTEGVDSVGASDQQVTEETPDGVVVDETDVGPTPDETGDVNSSTTEIIRLEPLVNEQNYFQFSKQSCVEVGDGAYHCTNKNAEGIDTQSAVYSDRGADGSMEIFLRTSKGKVKQLTENVYDDTSPNYDPESMRVVWQRLIDGRYQVVLFDIMQEKESQLTFSKTNNMEPKVSDAGVVWQAWDGNDWEIMLFDGTYTEQLTDNDAQDVAPVIQDGYVLWNVLGGAEQQARVYSLNTKETTSIVGHEGGSIINPRFVLVYDTEFSNGDVVTQSFDPATGLSEPIAAKPAPAPVNIPQSDPTGEIRALIQGKVQKDEKELHNDIGPDDGGGDLGAASSTDPGTLNLTAPGDSSIVQGAVILNASTTIENDFELTEYDLVIPQDAFENALLNAQE